MFRILISFGLGLVYVAPSVADDWPGWRGPRGDGTAEGTGHPVEWDADTNVRWKTPIPGAGNGSPVVVGGRVYLSATTGRDHSALHLLCLDAADGSVVWRTRLFGSAAEAPFSMFPPERGHAGATVAVNDGRVVALFGTGDLVALDLDGRPLWMRSLSGEYGTFRNDYGVAASPVLREGRAFVQVDHLNGSYLLAVDAATGRTLWKTERPGVFDNWATPAVAEVRGRVQLVCLGTRRVIGYDAEDGSELWSLGGLERLCATTPVVRDGRAYVVSGPAGAAFAIDLTAEPRRRVLWESRKNGPFVPSPVVSDGLFFMVNDQGIASCLDAETGEERWRERLGGSRMRPSPVAAGGLVYFTDLDGVTRVVRAADRFEVVAENPLGETVAASPALADGSVFIRGERHLFRIDPPGEGGVKPVP